MSNHWPIVTKAKPCSVCGKSDRCKVSPDGTAALCFRVSDGAVKDCKGTCWIHRVGNSHGDIRQEPIRVTPRRAVNWKVILAACAVSEKKVAVHAAQLGVSVESLVRLEIGYQGNGDWVFPMRDEFYQVCGIRVRNESGAKTSHVGSRNGMFIPTGFLERDDVVYIAEGPSDCAALLTIGLNAIGRASCSTCVYMLCEILVGRDAAIVSDNDGPGVRGAEILAGELSKRSKAKIINTAPFKDAREGVQSGWRP